MRILTAISTLVVLAACVLAAPAAVEPGPEGAASDLDAAPDSAHVSEVSEGAAPDLDAAAPDSAHVSEVSGGAASDLDAVLADYNAAIERALAIDSLRVTQEMIEPQDDGSSRSATAVLVYSNGEMRREEVRSTLRYPSGDYTLASLVGPFIRRGEYDVDFRGREVVEGQAGYRLELRALVRDADHFDGTVWVAEDGSGPVRIVGEVADPPFPALEIRLDKSFEPGPGGYRLLRRHTGEVRVSLILGSKWGLRHIFYEGYVLGAE